MYAYIAGNNSSNGKQAILLDIVVFDLFTTEVAVKWSSCLSDSLKISLAMVVLETLEANGALFGLQFDFCKARPITGELNKQQAYETEKSATITTKASCFHDSWHALNATNWNEIIIDTG